MNPARVIGRQARILAALATAVLAVNTATAAALTTPPPLPPGWNKHPPQPASTQPASKPLPGWNKHPPLPGGNKYPPLPGHIHAVATGGMPGWQIALIAIIGVVLVAAVHAPRPGLGTRRKTGIKGPGIDNKSLRPLLDGALTGEPPLGPVAQNALAVGIRLRRRRICLPLP